VTKSETWEYSARSRVLSSAMTLGLPLPGMSVRWPVERVARVARDVAVGMTVQELEAFEAAFEHEEAQSAKQRLA
jgi:hypothetical protein